jgi:hypothetical protein
MARTSVSSLVAHDGAGPRLGVFYEGNQTLLTGTATTAPSMQVSVSPLAFASQKALTEGVYIGRSVGTVLVDVAAAPASNSRIDVVYVMQRDKNATTSPDAVSQGEVGVITGTAAVSPTKPAIPAGAVEVGTLTIAAGVTATTNVGCTIATTCAWTTAAGADIAVRNQAERDAMTAFDGLQVYRLDTHTVETSNGTVWLGGPWLTYTPTLSGFTIGNGTLAGYYTISGKTVHYEIRVTIGSTTNITSNMGASLPFPPSRVNRPGGAVRLTHGASTQTWSSFIFSSGSLVFPENATGGLATISTPWGWASGDTWIIAGTYEAA